MRAPWTFSDVMDEFPRGSRVVSAHEPAASGEVTLVERSQFSDAGRVMVRWDSTGVECQVHPSQIRVAQ